MERTILIQPIGYFDKAVFHQIVRKAIHVVMAKVFGADMQGKELGHVNLKGPSVRAPFHNAFQIGPAQNVVKLFRKVHLGNFRGIFVTRRRHHLGEVTITTPFGGLWGGNCFARGSGGAGGASRMVGRYGRGRSGTHWGSCLCGQLFEQFLMLLQLGQLLVKGFHAIGWSICCGESSLLCVQSGK